jgi:hypothetical protein
MNEDLALFTRGTTSSLLETLRRSGYAIANPATGEVRGWNSEGEMVLLASEDEGVEFLRSENGLQLWRSDSEDLFVSIIMDRPCVSFDGMNDSEIAALIGALHSTGLQFELLLEDQLPEALDRAKIGVAG